MGKGTFLILICFTTFIIQAAFLDSSLSILKILYYLTSFILDIRDDDAFDLVKRVSVSR